MNYIDTGSARDTKATAIFNNNIGIAYYQLLDYEKSEEAFERSLDLSERVESNNDTDILKENILSVLYLKKELHKVSSFPLFFTDNFIADGLYGLNDSYERMMHHFLCYGLTKIINLIDLNLLYGAHGVRYGRRNVKTEVITINHNIVNNEELKLNISNTEEYYQRVISEWRKSNSIDSITMAFAYVSFADFYLFHKRNMSNAKTYYMRAHDILTKENPNNLLLAKVLFCLGACEKIQTDIYSNYFNPAIRIMESQLGINNQLVIEYKKTISDFIRH